MLLILKLVILNFGDILTARLWTVAKAKDNVCVENLLSFVTVFIFWVPVNFFFAVN